MRIFTLCSLILISTNFFAQSLKIDVEWDGEKSYTLGGNTFVVPETKNFKNNFDIFDFLGNAGGKIKILSSSKEQELIKRFYRNEENARQSSRISESDNQNIEQDNKEKH